MLNPPVHAQYDYSSLDEAFPAVDPGVRPFGSLVLVQLRTPKKKSAGGIIFTADTTETDKWNTQAAKVIALGPLAFHDRNKMQPWPEGFWCQPGDFVRVPKYAGDRWEVDLPGQENVSTERETAMFVLFNDLNILGAVTEDPRKMKAFI